MESSFMDDIDCGNFFDQIDDLIEFPPDNASGGNFVSSDDSKDFPSMWNDALPESDPLFSGNAASDLSAELSVPVSISSSWFLNAMSGDIYSISTVDQKIIYCMIQRYIGNLSWSLFKLGVVWL